MMFSLSTVDTLMVMQVIVTVVSGGELVSDGGFGQAEAELRLVFKHAIEVMEQKSDKVIKAGRIAEGRKE